MYLTLASNPPLLSSDVALVQRRSVALKDGGPAERALAGISPPLQRGRLLRARPHVYLAAAAAAENKVTTRLQTDTGRAFHARNALVLTINTG